FGDSELADAAERVLGKVETVLPIDRKGFVEGTPLFAHRARSAPGLSFDLAVLRRAIREHRTANLDYVDAEGATTRRRIRPLGMAFFGPSWLLMGWCELREDFRAFRPDRIRVLEVLDETFVDEPPRDLATYIDWLRREYPGATEPVCS
ncbi:MAG: WYL domain-containing protein, partial [Planctomycetota bacterium]